MSSKEIMIADDAAFMRKMVRSALEKAGFKEFIEAKNGKEAVELYKVKRPALVLMDVTMPEKTGVEALKEIIEFDSEATVIMCSAIGQDATIKESILSGAKEFIVKPFKRDELAEVVRSLLAEGDTE